MVIAIYQMFASPSKAGDQKVEFGSLMQEVQNNPTHLKHITIKGEHWTGEYSDGHKFRTIGPDKVGVDTLALLSHAGKNKDQAVAYDLEEKEENSLWTLLLGSWLPMLALVFIFF